VTYKSSVEFAGIKPGKPLSRSQQNHPFRMSSQHVTKLLGSAKWNCHCHTVSPACLRMQMGVLTVRRKPCYQEWSAQLSHPETFAARLDPTLEVQVSFVFRLVYRRRLPWMTLPTPIGTSKGVPLSTDESNLLPRLLGWLGS